MTDYGNELSKKHNIGIIVGTVFICLLLFVVLTEPVWDANHLINQQTSDCKKVGGVEIVDHGLFGNTYSCSPRYDRGYKGE